MFLPSSGSPPPVRASRQHLHRAKNTNARIPAGIVPLLIIGLMPAALHAQDAGVVVARVVNREVNTGHRVVGSVMPIQSSTVGTAVDGRVLEFLVNTGDAVKARQPLAKLRTGTLEIELAASQAELKLRKEELRQLKNGARPEDISEARARMLAAKANHKNSLTHLNRLKQLFERQATNQTDLDDARIFSLCRRPLAELKRDPVKKRLLRRPRESNCSRRTLNSSKTELRSTSSTRRSMAT